METEFIKTIQYETKTKFWKKREQQYWIVLWPVESLFVGGLEKHPGKTPSLAERATGSCNLYPM